MSHLRDLFYNPSGHEPVVRVAASSPGVPENPATTAQVTTTLAPRPNFPVEEVQIRPESRLVYHADPRSAAADRFRLLRMKLKANSNSGRLKKVLITSPLAHDGKSTVLLNLATVLAERGKRTVLVVEADLHHSSIAQTLRLKSWTGLTECLVDNETPFSAIRRIEPLGWYLLPAGEPRRNPTELLQTPAFSHIMEALVPSFDWILIDAPPVIPLTDSLSLQQHADASLLVVRAGHTPREAVEQSIALFGKKNILGIVLNGVEARNHLYYQYYDGTKRQDD